jgi:hypothetical protein
LVGAGHLSSAHWATADSAVALARLKGSEEALELFLPNAAAALEEQKAGHQKNAMVGLAIARGEIDLVAGEFDHAAQLVGFVDHQMEEGDLRDFVGRHERLRAEAEAGLEGDRFDKAFALGRAMDEGEAQQLITTR